MLMEHQHRPGSSTPDHCRDCEHDVYYMTGGSLT
jgi:hypothetical protein